MGTGPRRHRHLRYGNLVTAKPRWVMFLPKGTVYAQMVFHVTLRFVAGESRSEILQRVFVSLKLRLYQSDFVR
jgi:hypothetical protein